MDLTYKAAMKFATNRNILKLNSQYSEFYSARSYIFRFIRVILYFAFDDLEPLDWFYSFQKKYNIW